MSRSVESITAEALGAARVGDHVAIFSDTLQEVQRFADRAFQSVDGESDVKVVVTIGRAKVSFRSGGSVRFRSLNQSSRGVSLDKAYVPAAISHRHATELAPCLHGSSNPEMIGYFPL